MPDTQTIEYRATQLVYSIKFKQSHTIFHKPLYTKQMTNNNKQRQMTNKDKRQTMTNDKQQQTTNNNKRQTTTKDKQRQTRNNDNDK